MTATKCHCVKFDLPDGEDPANVPEGYTFKELPDYDMYTSEGDESLQALSMDHFTAIFGPGEDRPIEHNIWRMWRFKHNNTFLRVGIPRLNTHHSTIEVEAPEGINESLSNPTVQKNVEEFILNLLNDLSA